MRIAECAMTTIVSLETVEDEISIVSIFDYLGRKDQQSDKIDKRIEDIEKKYSELKVTAAVIKTELETYFDELHKKWNDFYSVGTRELIEKTKKDLKDAKNTKIKFSREECDEKKEKILRERHDLLDEIYQTSIRGPM